MPQVRVSLEKFQKGELPNVCAMSGAIARNNYLIAASSPNGPVAGGVPLTASSVQTLRKLQRLTLGFFLMSIVATSIAVAGRSGIWAGIGIALLGSAFGMLALTHNRSIKAKVDGEEVILSHVDIQFAKAITSPAKRCEGCTGSGTCSTAQTSECQTVNA